MTGLNDFRPSDLVRIKPWAPTNRGETGYVAKIGRRYVHVQFDAAYARFQPDELVILSFGAE